MRRHLSLLLLATLTLTPAAASACMNSIARAFETYPLDFVHFGLAAIVPLCVFWTDPDRTPPSLARQYAYIFSFAIAGLGYGFLAADVQELAPGRLFGTSVIAGGFIVLATALAEAGTSFAVRNFRRMLLVIAFFVALFSALQAESGTYDDPNGGFSEANASVQSQVVF